MRKFGTVNDISPKLKELIQPLQPKQFAELQLIDFRRITDPDTHQVTVIYPREHVWLRDQITDPFTGNLVDIGVVKSWDAAKEEVTAYEFIYFDNPSAGKFILNGNEAAHREIYEFVQICNICRDNLLSKEGNKVNDFRNASAHVLFYIVDDRKTARIKNKLYAAKGDALRFISQMNTQDMKEFCAAKNWPHNVEDEVLVEKINEYADKFPLEFKAEMEDPATKRKASIKYALDEGRISFNPAAYQIMNHDGSLLAQLDRRDNKNHIDMFDQWLLAHPDGQKILAQIRKGLKKEQAA